MIGLRLPSRREGTNIRSLLFDVLGGIPSPKSSERYICSADLTRRQGKACNESGYEKREKDRDSGSSSTITETRRKENLGTGKSLPSDS